MASPDRETSVLFRLSRDDKRRLAEDAAQLGITLQALLERRVLGKADAERLPKGRTPRAQQEMLPMTG